VLFVVVVLVVSRGKAEARTQERVARARSWFFIFCLWRGGTRGRGGVWEAVEVCVKLDGDGSRSQGRYLPSTGIHILYLYPPFPKALVVLCSG